MHLRTHIIDNGGVPCYWHVYKCDRCGTSIQDGDPHHAERKLNYHLCWDCSFIEAKISEQEFLKYCGGGSHENAHAVIIEGKVIVWVGKKNPFERKDSEYRKTKQYRDWRKQVFDRDGRSCQHCGSKENLQAHHIKPFSTHVKQRFKVSNGLTLCKNCHLAEHKRMKQGEPNVRRVSNE